MSGEVPVTELMRAATTSTADPLVAVHDRVLWLSTAMVHHANRIRVNQSGLKVGGHQASSASIAAIMTALWFEHLRAHDRVSVKPHASPVLHAINYLLGNLDEHYLSTLRQFGGLQPYPSRSKDPDPVDYSTGSVGIGATAPIWAAISRRYVNAHTGGADVGRQFSLVGDAELDEGAVWEAILDPAVAELGEVVWVVDLNRQSLDRVVPNIAARRLEKMFNAAGWQVVTAAFGGILTSLFSGVGGPALRDRVLQMSNPEYQRLLRCDAAELRRRLPGPGQRGKQVGALIEQLDDATLTAAIRNLGGHDFSALRQAFQAIDDSRPTVILAYTIKGFGLPVEGHPQNHSALLTAEQFAELAVRMNMDPNNPWQRFAADSDPGRLCAATADRLSRVVSPAAQVHTVPTDFRRTPKGTATTQAALGRVLLDLTREAPETAKRVVTVSPDVSTSTSLAGWVNKVGVWSATERRNWFDDDAETIMHWQEKPTGQHIELGIAETNLAGLIGELGSTWSRYGQSLYPIGVLYDPFVSRALEPWSFGIYAGGQSILVGTPSGVTLAAEGGAHQSVTTPSIGLAQPGCISYEPAFALDTEWTLLASLARLGRPDGASAYLRLSTRPIDQSLAAIPDDAVARERRRRQVIAGGYPLIRRDAPQVAIVAMGAVVVEALAAAARLDGLGIATDVICVTSPRLLFDAIQARHGRGPGSTWILDQLFPADRAAPMVTVLDGHPHTLAFLATVNRVRSIALGVTEFGQAGDLEDVYRHHGIGSDGIVSAALDALRR